MPDVKDLLGGGASREEMLVWVAEVQIPKVEHNLCEAQSHVKQPQRNLNLLILLISATGLQTPRHYCYPVFLLLLRGPRQDRQGKKMDGTQTCDTEPGQLYHKENKLSLCADKIHGWESSPKLNGITH